MDSRRRHVGDLRKRAAEASARLVRLYEAIESGVADASDPHLKDRVRQLQELRDSTTQDADRAGRAIERLGPLITPELLKQFSDATREMLRNEDGTFRRDRLRAVAQRVEIKSANLIEISGSPFELFRTLAATGGEKAAALAVPARIPEPHLERATSGNKAADADLVPTRVPEWRAMLDTGANYSFEISIKKPRRRKASQRSPTVSLLV